MIRGARNALIRATAAALQKYVDKVTSSKRTHAHYRQRMPLRWLPNFTFNLVVIALVFLDPRAAAKSGKEMELHVLWTVGTLGGLLLIGLGVVFFVSLKSFLVLLRLLYVKFGPLFACI